MSKLSDVYEISALCRFVKRTHNNEIESHHKTWFVYISNEFMNMVRILFFFFSLFLSSSFFGDPSKRSRIYIIDRISANGIERVRRKNRVKNPEKNIHGKFKSWARKNICKNNTQHKCWIYYYNRLDWWQSTLIENFMRKKHVSSMFFFSVFDMWVSKQLGSQSNNSYIYRIKTSVCSHKFDKDGKCVCEIHTVNNIFILKLSVRNRTLFQRRWKHAPQRKKKSRKKQRM